MSNFFIDKILASGKARIGYYTASGGQMLLEAPDGNALIITKMRLSAFADLPSGEDFTTIDDRLGRFTWHQLRVNGTMGISVFHARHKLNIVASAGGTFSIPDGSTTWDKLYIPSDGNILFDLSHAPSIDDYAVNIGPLPEAVKKPTPIQPPTGYGQEGYPVFRQTVDLLTWSNASPLSWEHRPFGTYTTPSVARNSSSKFIWSINDTTELNPPLVGVSAIPYGELTIPLLEVEYIAFNKSPDWNFPGAI